MEYPINKNGMYVLSIWDQMEVNDLRFTDFEKVSLIYNNALNEYRKRPGEKK